MTFTNLLTLLFVALKLTNYITWSWLWVLSPTWVPLALAGIVFTFMVLIFGFNQTQQAINQTYLKRK